MQALQKYRQIHADFPTNLECLRYLVHICGEQGTSSALSSMLVAACLYQRIRHVAAFFAGLRQEEAEYTAQLRKAERAQPQSRVSDADCVNRPAEVCCL